MNNHSVAIHPLHIDDAASLMMLQKESPGRPWSLEEIKQLLENPTIYGWTIKKERKIYGFILVQKILDTVDILDFVVMKTARRHGFGQQLYDYFETTCKQDHITEIFLDVAVNNDAAFAFYQKQSFIKVGFRPQYYTSSSSKEDSLSMKKTIIVV